GRLDHAALDLVGEAVRVDDEPRVGGGPGARDLHLSALAIDLDLRDHRYVGGEVLVLRETDAAAAAVASARTGTPACLCCNGLDHRFRPRIGKMPQTELDRIGAGRERQ